MADKSALEVVRREVDRLRIRAAASGVSNDRFAELQRVSTELSKSSRYGSAVSFLGHLVDADIGN